MSITNAAAGNTFEVIGPGAILADSRAPQVQKSPATFHLSKETQVANSIYLLKVKTKSGPRYIAKHGVGRTETLHPSMARKINFNERLSSDIASLIDDYAGGEFIVVSQATCLHPRCGCTWEDEKTKVK